MRITHKVDYAVRAMVVLASADVEHPGVPLKREALASAEGIPPAFLDDILRALRNGGLVTSQRGAEGGWRLARPAAAITVADVIRAVEGPLANVRGIRPHELTYEHTRAPLTRLWVAVRSALRSVLEATTIADLAAGTLPPDVDLLADDPEAWSSR